MKIIRILAVLCAAWLSSPALAANVAVAVTPAVQNAAYASGNALGSLQTVAFFLYGGRSGVLDAIQLMSKGGATPAVTFYIFDTLPAATTCSDKTAFSLGAADVAKLAVQPFTLTPAATTGTTVSSAQLIQASSVQNRDVSTSSAQLPNLYVCLVVGGAVTPPSTSDIVIKLSGALD